MARNKSRVDDYFDGQQASCDGCFDLTRAKSWVAGVVMSLAGMTLENNNSGG